MGKEEKKNWERLRGAHEYASVWHECMQIGAAGPVMMM